jgi:carboxymethylenebutenolidase
VVVIHDAVGLGDITKIHADHLAAAGYVALAPDLYSRGGRLRCVRATFSALLSGKGTPVDDIEVVRHWLTDQGDCTGRVGVIGFCMGGGFALLTAAKGFDASAPNYGHLPRDLSALDGACPIVASFGGKDRMLPGVAAKLQRELSARGVPHDVKEYPGVGHSFLDRFNAGPFTGLVRVAGLGYDHDTAEDAWRRIFQFFGEHLGGGPVSPAVTRSPGE